MIDLRKRQLWRRTAFSVWTLEMCSLGISMMQMTWGNTVSFLVSSTVNSWSTSPSSTCHHRYHNFVQVTKIIPACLHLQLPQVVRHWLQSQSSFSGPWCAEPSRSGAAPRRWLCRFRCKSWSHSFFLFQSPLQYGQGLSPRNWRCCQRLCLCSWSEKGYAEFGEICLPRNLPSNLVSEAISCALFSQIRNK